VLHALTKQDLSDLLAAYHLQADPANALIAPSLIRNEHPITDAGMPPPHPGPSVLPVPSAGCYPV